MTMPNFLIIGAMKSGTTALYHYLRQHPQIYMNPKLKEPRFFCYEGRTLTFGGPMNPRVYSAIITRLEDYQAYFQDVTNQVAVGEASIEYLYVPGTAERIHAHIPHAKLIAILRHPVERAYSNYNYMVREGVETYADFAQALQQESERIRQNWAPPWHYLQVGFFYSQIKRYLRIFNRQQIRIYLYDDFERNPIGIVKDIFHFLEVDDSFVPDVSLKHNVSGTPRSRTVMTFLDGPHPLKTIFKPFLPSQTRFKIQERLRNLNLHPPPPLDPALRARLTELYREDILKLQDLLGRDLSHWLEPQRANRARTASESR